EFHLKARPDDPCLLGHGAAAPGVGGEHVVGLAYLGLLLRAAPEKLNLLEPHPFHAVHVRANDGGISVGPERLERVFAGLREEILLAEHMAAELLAEEV